MVVQPQLCGVALCGCAHFTEDGNTFDDDGGPHACNGERLAGGEDALAARLFDFFKVLATEWVQQADRILVFFLILCVCV